MENSTTTPASRAGLLSQVRELLHEGSRLPTREENAAALTMCRACEHFTEHDPKQDGASTCAKCSKCKTKIVRFGLPRKRWNCPLKKWRAAAGQVLWLIAGGIGDAMMYVPGLKSLVDAGYGIDIRLMRGTCRLAEPLMRALGLRVISDAEMRDGRHYAAAICPTKYSALQKRTEGVSVDRLINPTNWRAGPVHWAQDCAEQLGAPKRRPPYNVLAHLLPHRRAPKHIVVGPGCGPKENNKKKLWAGWADFAAETGRMGLPLIVVGSADVEPWQDAPHITDLIGKTQGLDELLDIWADAALYVGIDNGLGHYAAACGVPSLTIFNATSPARYTPWHPGARAVPADAVDGVILARQAGAMFRAAPLTMHHPLLSVVIGSYNEGDEIRLTCENVHEHAGCDTEIIVVDDHSTDGSCDDLPPYVQVIRAEGADRLGVAPSRNIGARYATGDALTFLDGHMRTDPGALARLMDVALKRQACVAACLSNLYGSSRVWHGSYAEIRTDKARLSSKFYKRPHPRELWESPMFVAPGYVLPREVFERVGGWPLQLRGWGQTEITLAVKLWLAGVPMLVHEGAWLQHKFKSSFGYHVGNSEVLRNNHIMCATCFEPKTAVEFWIPLEKTHRYWSDKILETVDADGIGVEHEAFQAQRARSDNEWFRAVLKMTILEAQEKYLP